MNVPRPTWLLMEALGFQFGVGAGDSSHRHADILRQIALRRKPLTGMHFSFGNRGDDRFNDGAVSDPSAKLCQLGD